MISQPLSKIDPEKCKIDPVLRRVITEKRRDYLLGSLEKNATRGLRGNLPHGVDQEILPKNCGVIGWDWRYSKQYVYAMKLNLSSSVYYHSKYDEQRISTGWGSDIVENITIEMPCVISIEGIVPSEAIMESMIGRHVTDVFDHKAFHDERCIIKHSSYNTVNSKPFGFCVILDQQYEKFI
jgi:hypothetical protein